MTCYDCCNFYQEGCFGSYTMCMCKIYGSLDVDQQERHPDTAAATCKMYNVELSFSEKKHSFIDFKNFEPFIDF